MKEIKVDKALLERAKEIIKTNKNLVDKDIITDAINIRNQIQNQISEAYHKFEDAELAEFKMKMENSDFPDEEKTKILEKKCDELKKSIIRDGQADFLERKLANFISENSICETCLKCENLINIYLQYTEKYNTATMDEICKTRSRLCNAMINCEKENCRAQELINILDYDLVIRKNKGL